ncbi:MAG: hypothetical protein DRG78_11110 [Epsilonproteobacteria bacterium]|nr:MAG: hypothetical protein DRG78_11110 [Campylobacterota bacterium]
MNNILMNVEMTKAILDGRKTQTRRIIKGTSSMLEYALNTLNLPLSDFKPKYKKDEVVWLREPAEVIAYDTETLELCYRFKADNNINAKSIIMPNRFIYPNPNHPKWAINCQGIPNGCIKEMARIFLKIVDVRVEKLQDITIQDIGKEGSLMDVKYTEDIGEDDFAYEWWIDTWNETAQKGYKWEDTPYVFIYEFKRVNNDTRNI